MAKKRAKRSSSKVTKRASAKTQALPKRRKKLYSTAAAGAKESKTMMEWRRLVRGLSAPKGMRWDAHARGRKVARLLDSDGVALAVMRAADDGLCQVRCIDGWRCGSHTERRTPGDMARVIVDHVEKTMARTRPDSERAVRRRLPRFTRLQRFVGKGYGLAAESWEFQESLDDWAVKREADRCPPKGSGWILLDWQIVGLGRADSCNCCGPTQFRSVCLWARKRPRNELGG